MILVEGQTVVMLLLRRGGCGCSGLSLLSMGQGLVILLRAIMLPGRLVVLAVLLLMRVKMLRLKHGGGSLCVCRSASGQSHPRFKGQGE